MSVAKAPVPARREVGGGGGGGAQGPQQVGGRAVGAPGQLPFLDPGPGCAGGPSSPQPWVHCLWFSTFFHMHDMRPASLQVF